MAGLLRGSKRLLGLPRAFQAVGVSYTDRASQTLCFDASFATLLNKSGETKAQAQKSDPAGQTRGRALSAFNFFFKDAFKAIQEKHPENPPNLPTAMSEVSAKWKALSDEEKKPYIEASKANKQSQPSRKSGKPPRALTGYNVFVRENFESVKARNPTVQARQILLNMGREWTTLAASEKQKYKEKADKSNQTAGTA